MRTILDVGIWLGLAYGVVLVLVYLLQARLIYLPGYGGGTLETTPGDVGLDFEDVRFSTADGEELHGWYVASESALGTVLFFHGNAGNISHRLDSIAAFHALGLNVFIFDYRGYGRSTGRPHERGTYADAEAAWDYLTRVRGEPEGRIVLFGRSLGAAVASHLATHHRPAALILESAFSSAADLGAEVYPFLPVRLLLRHRYPTAQHVRGVSSPVLVIHSREDDIVPFSHGRAIYEAAAEPRTFLEIEGGHNDGFALSASRWRAGVGTFLERHLSGRR